MGSAEAPMPEADIIETGLEPRFFVNTCVRVELMPDGMVLLTYGLKHGNKINVEFSVLVTVTTAFELGKHAQATAIEANNELAFKGDLGKPN